MAKDSFYEENVRFDNGKTLKSKNIDMPIIVEDEFEQENIIQNQVDFQSSDAESGRKELRESQAKNHTLGDQDVILRPPPTAPLLRNLQRDELIRDSNFQSFNEIKGSNLFQEDFRMISINTYNNDKNAFFQDSLD